MIKQIKLFWRAFRAARDAQKPGVGHGAGAEIRLSEEAIELLLTPAFSDQYPADFALTEAHVALIRRIRLNWNGAEAGAPEVDLHQPYRGGRAVDLLDGLLGAESDDIERARFLVAMPAALTAFCQTARIAPGRYVLENIDRVQVDQAAGGDDGIAALFAIGRDMGVEIGADEIALIRALQWRAAHADDAEMTLERGDVAGPTVDPKRPFGDMTFYQLDIHRVLGWPVERRNDKGYIELSEEQIERGQALHFRMLGALQAFLEAATLPEGGPA